MSCLQEFAGQYVTVELSGNKRITGNLIDYALDLLVINQSGNFYYIPLVHVQNISRETFLDANEMSTPVPFDHPFQVDGGQSSLRKVLMSARGHFMEVYVSGNTTIHGYLTSVMNDYFVFHSPVYKTIYVVLSHVKWLMPYHEHVIPYALNPESIPHRSVSTSLPRAFKEQCKKFTGNLVIFDMGDHPNKIGQLKSVDVDNNMAELFTADGSKHVLNLHHLKSMYVP